MTVSVLSVAARAGDDIAVSFEIKEGEHAQRECFVISAALLADLRLSVGECTRECYDTVCQASEVYRAKKRGLNILAYGTASKIGLYRKLLSKGISKDIAKEAVRELAAEGYINADEDALREAEKCVGKLWGKRRIAAALYQKGYTDRQVKAALCDLEDRGTDFSEICAERLRRTNSELPTEPKEKQRLAASLMRYGFSTSEIKDALEILKSKI